MAVEAGSAPARAGRGPARQIVARPAALLTRFTAEVSGAYKAARGYPPAHRGGAGMFDWITGLVEQTGYLGIALLMLAENVFPRLST